MSIYLVEIPHQFPPSVWVGTDQADIIKRANAQHDASRSGRTIFDKITSRQLLEQFGFTPTDCPSGECEFIRELASKYGWDTRLYRADYMRGEGEYTAEVLEEYEAVLSYIGHDLHMLKIFNTDAEAIEALNNAAEWACHQGLKAAAALKRALLKTSALTKAAILGVQS